MFTSHGNIRRKQKGPRAPPKPSSDRVVMKRLRDERIRRAGADEQSNHLHNDNNQNPNDNNQQDHENEDDIYSDNNDNRDAAW